MKREGLLLITLIGGFAAGASGADLGECVAIKDDAVRLFCYDRAAGRATATESPAPVVGATLGAIVVQPPKPAAAAAEPVEIKRIESRIVGSFDGWRQGTRFRLENGQTWEAIGTGTFNTRKIDAPAVVIERDFIGQLKMTVDGMKARASVRLIDPD